MSEVEVVVPRRVWELVLSPDVGPWATQNGLPVPEFRARGRGEQAVLRVDAGTEAAIYGRAEERMSAIEVPADRQRVRSWLNRVKGEPSPPRRAGRRRRGGGDSTGRRRRNVDESVRHYLELVDTGSVPTIGSDRSAEEIRAEMDGVDEQLSVTDDVLARLHLLAQRRRLEGELSPRPVGTPDDLEAAFVRDAAAFADQHGYDAEVFAEFGVPAEVLDRAGLGRIEG